MAMTTNVAPIDKTLAAVLRGAYRTRGLTQEQLSEATGITLTTIQRLMAGKSSFQVAQLYALVEAIGWKTAGEYLSEAEGLL